GSVNVSAAQIAMGSGARILSTTAGTGKGGSVSVKTPGSLNIEAPDARTQIGASATGAQSGDAGSVRVEAGSLAMLNTQIASTTAGGGRGGDVDVIITGAVALD